MPWLRTLPEGQGPKKNSRTLGIRSPRKTAYDFFRMDCIGDHGRVNQAFSTYDEKKEAMEVGSYNYRFKQPES